MISGMDDHLDVIRDVLEIFSQFRVLIVYVQNIQFLFLTREYPDTVNDIPREYDVIDLHLLAVLFEVSDHPLPIVL